MKKLKLLDTFSGIGGFSYAAEKLVGGFETTQFIEIDPYCQKVLNKHWPNVPIHDDIRTFTAFFGQFDIICGGFPCQSISVAGNRAGITEESRSGIFYELMRVIRMVRPRFVVLENVAAILNNGLDIVLGELSQAGYDAEWSIISASSLGACHRRSRWWCVAYTNDYGSSSTKIIGLDDKTDNDSSERTNQISEFTGSSKSSNSQTFQSITETSNANSYECKTGSKQLQQQRTTTVRSSYKLADSNSNRLERKKWSGIYRETWNSEDTRCLNSNWRQYVSKPLLPRGSDGLSNRVDRTRALGNSIVPVVAAIPLQRVKTLHESLTSVDH